MEVPETLLVKEMVFLGALYRLLRLEEKLDPSHPAVVMSLFAERFGIDPTQENMEKIFDLIQPVWLGFLEEENKALQIMREILENK